MGMPESTSTAPLQLRKQYKESSSASSFITKLFQMISGPDKNISWSQNGATFIVRGDIQKLEKETIPQYFRHGRLASLIRQLNFYNFKKVNRERNVWVYKHDLFHRDHPENLKDIRRRPGPGRTSSNSRSTLNRSSPRVSLQEEEWDSGFDQLDGDTSIGMNVSGKKRILATPSPSGPSKKISCIDTLTMQSEAGAVSEDWDDHANLSNVSERESNVEQADIVSSVASKLDQYAKHRCFGVVTPSFLSSWSSNPSSGSVLTYDDELHDALDYGMEDSETGSTAIASLNDSSKGFVGVKTLVNFETIQRISQTIRKSNIDGCETASKLVSYVLMANTTETSISMKAKLVLQSCARLMSEFVRYRAALNPLAIIKCDWEEGSTYSHDVARDFSVFVVNYLNRFIHTCSCENDATLLKNSLESMQMTVFADT